MATQVGKLNVQVTADAAPAAAGMEQAKKKSKEAGDSITADAKKAAEAQQKILDDLKKKEADYAKGVAARVQSASPGLAQRAWSRSMETTRTGADGRQQVLTQGWFGLRYQDAVKVEESLKRQARLMERMALLRKGMSVVGVAGAAVSGIGALGGNAIAEADIKSRRLGLTINELRVATLAGGRAGEQMAQAFGSLAVTLADARSGAGGAKRLLGAFDVKDFSAGTTTDAFEKIAATIAAVEDPTRKAAMAWKLFGANYVDILPSLDRGAEGIERAKKMMSGFGLGVGERDLANIRRVQQAMQDLKAMWDGVVNQLTLALAPFAAKLSEIFDPSNLDISWLRDAFTDTIDAIGRGVTTTYAVLSDTSLIREGFDVLLQYLDAAFAKFFAEQAKRLSDFAKLTASAFGPLLDPLMQAGAGQVGAFVDKVGVKGMDEANAALEKFNARIEKTDPAKFWKGFMSDIRGRQGGPAAGKAAAEAPPSWVIALGESFKTLKSGVEDPLEKFEKAQRDIVQMEKAGLFTGEKAGLRSRFSSKAFTDLAQAVQLPTTSLAGAAMKGSREAYTAVTQYERQAGRRDVPGLLQQLKDEAKRAQDEQIRIGKEIVEELRKQNAADERGGMGGLIDFMVKGM